MIEREQMILELKERLEWLEQSISENDDYASEAEAIRQFLRKLDSPRLNLDEKYFSPQEAVKRFWDTYETRMEIDHEKQKILTGELLRKTVPEIPDSEMDSTDSEIRNARAEKPGLEKPGAEENSGNVENGFFWYLARHKRFAVAAVALMAVVILAVGGTVGAYAESQTGIFSFFQKDEKRMEAVVNLEGDFDASKDYEGGQEFSSFEELPEKYKENLMLPLDFNNEYFAKNIHVLETTLNTVFEVRYNDGADRNIFCFQRCFKENETYFLQLYDDYTLMSEKLIEKTKVYFYVGKDKKKNIYIASFYINDTLFIIVSNIDIEIMEEFAECILQQKKFINKVE